MRRPWSARWGRGRVRVGPACWQQPTEVGHGRGVDGSAAPFHKVAASASLAKHSTGELALVPGGPSKSRRNGRRPTRRSSPPRTIPIAATPGPPGPTNIAPIGRSGLLADFLITARLICSPPRSDQSNGTGTLAHSSRSPLEAQSIPVAAPEPGAREPAEPTRGEQGRHGRCSDSCRTPPAQR